MLTEKLPFAHPAWIEIDLRQFKLNLALIRQQAKNSKLCLPIKSNAYGHGLIPIARAASEAHVDYLAVSCLQEGALLRQAGIKLPILVMGAIHEEQINQLLDYELELSISSHYKAELVAKKCLELQRKCKVHVEVDTGMQRTGVRPSSTLSLLNFLEEKECFELTGVYSHLATADSPDNPEAKHQIQVFQTFVNDYIKNTRNNIICHLANSGGLCYYTESYMDMIRPGILSFGYFPSKPHKILTEIKPFFSVKANIGFFKVVAKGEGISYGHTYHTTADTRIVTIPIGYGDGYRRSLSNRGEVLIRGKRYPIAGTICMDQLMVDIHRDEAFVGEEVILIGKQGNEEIPLTKIAELCDTIPYEILCGFNNRLPRLYIDHDRRFYEIDSR